MSNSEYLLDGHSSRQVGVPTQKKGSQSELTIQMTAEGLVQDVGLELAHMGSQVKGGGGSGRPRAQCFGSKHRISCLV